MKASPRLGAGLTEGGELSDDSIRAAAEKVAHMATLARQLGASKIEAVATSAVRDATNGDAFLDLVREQTGLKVRVLSGEEEARLRFRSALAHFDLGVGRAVVMDIGGGSLELALTADGLLERLVSLPFGALRLTEQFLEEPIRRRDVRKLRKHVREELRTKLRARDWRGAQLIGSGGTFTTSPPCRSRGRRSAPRERCTARAFRGSSSSTCSKRCRTCRPRSDAAVPGLNPARADIIVAGLAVAAEVIARLEAPRAPRLRLRHSRGAAARDRARRAAVGRSG